MDIHVLQEHANNTSIEGIEFFNRHSESVIVYIAYLVLAILTGIAGNVIVIGVMIISKNLRKSSNAFIINMAVADIVVTMFVDSFSLVGILVGERFFAERPALCTIVASLCLTSCYCSLLNIGAVSVERCIYICHNSAYRRVYSQRNVIFMCLALWLFSFSLEMPNFFGWGGHRYLDKSHGCYFDWERSYSYTCFFVFVGVFIPLVVIVCCYIRIYRYVMAAKRRATGECHSRQLQREHQQVSIALAKTFFLVFIVFVICWTPFVVVMVGDRYRAFPFQAYLFAVALAHSSSSWNPIVYATTNRVFRNGFKQLFLCCCSCCHAREEDYSVHAVTHSSSVKRSPTSSVWVSSNHH